MSQGGHHVSGIIHLPLSVTIPVVRVLVRVKTVDGHAIGEIDVVFGQVGIVVFSQSLYIGLSRHSVIGHVADAQRHGLSHFVFPEVVNHHVHVVIRLPQVLPIALGASLVVHEVIGIYGVGCMILTVFHAWEGQHLSLFICLGGHEPHLHVHTLGVNSSLVKLIDMFQRFPQPCGIDILLGVAGVIIEHVKNDRYLIDVVFTDRGHVWGGRLYAATLIVTATSRQQRNQQREKNKETTSHMELTLKCKMVAACKYTNYFPYRYAFMAKYAEYPPL